MTKVVSLKGEPVIQREVDSTVVKELEDMLGRARAGDIVGIACGFINHDKTVGYSRAGWYSFALSGLLMMLAGKIVRLLEEN